MTKKTAIMGLLVATLVGASFAQRVPFPKGSRTSITSSSS